MKLSQIQVIIKLVGIIERFVGDVEDVGSPVGWYWGGEDDNEPMFVKYCLTPFNLTEDEVTDCATTSCGPVLWMVRAIGCRWGLSISSVDWVYYNRCMERR